MQFSVPVVLFLIFVVYFEVKKRKEKKGSWQGSDQRELGTMAAFAGDDLSRATSSRRSWGSGSVRGSVREIWQGPPDIFARNSTRREMVDDEEELKWAAIERLPTYDRMRKGMLKQVVSNGRLISNEVDVADLGAQDKKQLMDSILKVVEDDNERFLRRLRDRTDR